MKHRTLRRKINDYTQTNCPNFKHISIFYRFSWLLVYASKIKIKMLLGDLNGDHEAVAFRTLFSWALSLHNHLQNGLISLRHVLSYCLRFTQIYVIDFFPYLYVIMCWGNSFKLPVCMMLFFYLWPLQLWPRGQYISNVNLKGFNLFRREFWCTDQQTPRLVFCP